jgi:hypothetical protein
MLLREWDPIGVEGIREAAAEYYSYIWQVTGLLRSLHVTTNRLADVNHPRPFASRGHGRPERGHALFCRELRIRGGGL